MVLDGPIDDVVEQHTPARRCVLEAIGGPGRAAELLREDPRASGVVVEDGACVFEIEGGETDAAAILSDLVGAGIPVSSFHQRRQGVEDVLLKIGASRTS